MAALSQQLPLRDMLTIIPVCAWHSTPPLASAELPVCAHTSSPVRAIRPASEDSHICLDGCEIPVEWLLPVGHLLVCVDRWDACARRTSHFPRRRALGT